MSPLDSTLERARRSAVASGLSFHVVEVVGGAFLIPQGHSYVGVDDALAHLEIAMAKRKDAGHQDHRLIAMRAVLPSGAVVRVTA